MNLGRLVDNIGALILRQVTTWSLTTLLVLFMPRYLGDEGVGKTTFATSIMTLLLVVTNLGTSTYIVKRISVEGADWSDLFWNSSLLRLVLGGGVFAAMLPLISLAGVEGEMRGVLYLTGVTLIVVSLQRGVEAAIQGLERMRWLSLADIGNKAVLALLGIALLEAGFGVVVFSAVILAGWTVALLIEVWALLQSGLGPPRFRLGGLRLLVLGGLPFLIASAISQTYQWSDVTVLRLLTTDAVVGWYGVASQLCNTLNFLPLVLTTALLPPMSRAFASRDYAAFLSMSRNGFRLVLATSLPLALALAYLSTSLIRLLGYPVEFGRAAPVLAVLAVNLPLTGALILVNTVIISMDRQAEWVKVMAFSLALNLAAGALLIWVCDSLWGNGGLGSASAAVLAETAQVVLGLRLLPRGFLGRAFYAQTSRLLVALAGMGAVLLAGSLLTSLPPLLLTAAAGAVYTGALLLLGSVRPEDARLLLREWVRGRSREPGTRNQGVGVGTGVARSIEQKAHAG